MKFEPWTFAYSLLGKRIEKILPQFQELHIQLKKSGMRISFKAYVSFMILISAIAGIASFALSLALLPMLTGTSLLSGPTLVLSPMLAALTFIFTLMIIYIYPGTKASNRKRPIENNLPYISSFLTLLSGSNVPPSIIFSSVARIDTLKEVKQEFSNIVRDVEIFGNDLMTSILENVRYTPSEKLRDLLTGYVSTIRTGGNPTEYLKVQNEMITKDRISRLDMMLESLSAVAEVYIMILVAMPLLFVVLFFCPRYVRKRRQYNESKPAPLPPNLRRNPDNGSNHDGNDFYIREVTTMKITKKAIKKTAIISSIVGIVFLLASIILFFGSPDMDYMVVIAFSIAVTPPAIAGTLYNRWKTRIEKAIPEFLRDLATASLTGMPIQTALEHTSKRYYGPLTVELKQLVAQMSWGMTFEEALMEFSKRIDLPLIKKASTLIIEAGRHGGNLTEIFENTAKYVDSVNSWANKRRMQTMPYVAIFYFSVFMYLFIIILISSMIFVRMGTMALAGSALLKPVLSAAESKTLFLNTALLESLFGGLMAGKINEDSFTAGLKHTAVLAIASGLAFYVFFR